MKKADAHSHIFPSKIAKKASDSIGQFYGIPMYSDASVEALLAAEAEIGVDRMIVCSSAVTESQVHTINDFIAEQCRLHPSFVGLCALHQDSKDYDEVLDKAVEDGLKGVKFHPDFQKFAIDDDRVIPMYKAIAKRGFPVLFHTGDSRYDFSGPTRLKNLISKVPDLKVIGAHFGGYSQWADIKSLPRSENLWFDTSSALPFISTAQAEDFISYFGHDRFMFGTDFPMWKPAEEEVRFLALKMSDSERADMYWNTFAKLFNIE